MTNKEQDHVDELLRLAKALEYEGTAATNAGLDISINIYTYTKDEKRTVSCYINIDRPLLNYSTEAGE